MTQHELDMVRQVLSDAYWTKLTVEEAVALNSLFQAVENAPGARSAEEERADVVAWLRGEDAKWLDGEAPLLLLAKEIEGREHVGASQRGVS